MFRLRHFVFCPCGLLLLASFSRPLFTSVHNRLANLKETLAPESAPLINGNEKSAKAHQLNTDYGKLPVYFEPNLGQTDSQVKFITRGSGVTTFLAATEAVFSLPQGRHSRDRGNPDPVPSDQQGMSPVGLRNLGRVFGLDVIDSSPRNRDSQTPHIPQSTIGNRRSAITMRLVGANPNAIVEGLDRMLSISNYFIGDDPAKWRTNVPHYAKVRYRDVYPGIDLIYHGNPQQFEYDFVVKPQGDPNQINMAFFGADSIRLNEGGDLSLETRAIEILHHKPSVYQIRDGLRCQIKGHYVSRSQNVFAFKLEGYDTAKALVIDPVITFDFQFPGLGEHVTNGRAIAVDSAGNTYVAGATNDPNFPVTPGALQPSYQGGNLCGGKLKHPCEDSFVAKLDPTGNSLLWATYLGGKQGETPFGVALDGQGNVYLTGSTNSSDFPTTSGTFQTVLRPGSCGSIYMEACTDVFVAKLSTQGNALVYSTLLGGTNADVGAGIAVDGAGNAHVTGTTASTDFPLVSALLTTLSNTAAFVTKVNVSGSGLLYSTYLGGQDGATEGTGLALDANGFAYITGQTSSTTFPTRNAFQASRAPENPTEGAYETLTDAFVTKLNPQATEMVYSTYLGGSRGDRAAAIALDSSSNAYVSGATASDNFPTLNAVQRMNRGGIDPYKGFDAFVTKLSAAGNRLLYSTYLGGDYDDSVFSMAVDSAGSAYIVGITESNDFPLFHPFDTGSDAEQTVDGFVAKLGSSGASLAYSSYLGGTGTRIAVSSSGKAHITAIDRVLSVADAPETYIPPVLFVPIVLSSSGLNSSFFTSELTLTNRSRHEIQLEFTYTPAFGGGGGIAVDALGAGQQKIVPDAIVYLRGLGIPLPDSGNRGGTLRVRVSGLVTYSDVAITVRTTTSNSKGRAGLSYAAVPIWRTFTGPSYVCGLRQNSSDRSNLAIQNAGADSDGDIQLRLTVFSGNPSAPSATTLPVETLSPGGFKQISGILRSNGLALESGYVRIERVSGSAPYYGYGVINDQITSDGSFLAPTPSPFVWTGVFSWLPTVLETGSYSTEVVLTNLSQESRMLELSYTADAIQTADKTSRTTIDLNAGQQLIIPNFVQYLRERGAAGVGARGQHYVGQLQVRMDHGLDLFVGARTSTESVDGRYGVFYAGIPFFSSRNSAWIYGLQQNSETRSNLALLTLGESVDNFFEIELFDGETGLRVKTIEGVAVSAGGWKQLGSVLENYAPGTSQGYARVKRKVGYLFFDTYAVINDGATPGERTGDGAFIASSP